MRFVLSALFLSFALAACDTPSGSPDDGSPRAVTFSPAWAPIPSGFANGTNGSPPALIAAYGDAVVVAGTFASASYRYLSLDRGLTWETFSTPLSAPVLFENGPKGVAMGAAGPVRFDLSARTFTAIPNPSGVSSLFLGGLRLRDGAVFGYSSDGQVYRHRSGSWTRLDVPGSGFPSSVVADEANTIVVLRQNAPQQITVSTDDGATWTVRSSPSSDQAAFLPSGTLLLYGAAIYRSTDKGATWQTVPPPANHTMLEGVHTTPDGNVWIGGVRAADGALPWIPVFDRSVVSETSSNDRIVPNATGGFVFASGTEGLFTTPPEGSPLMYAGGFALTKTAQRTDDPLDSYHSVVVLSDGSALAGGARYDLALRRWIRSGPGGHISRLSDGRLASHHACVVRFSADDGRSWSNAVYPNTDTGEVMRCSSSHEVVRLANGRLVANQLWQAYSYSTTERRLYESADNGLTWSLVWKRQLGPSPMAFDGNRVYTSGYVVDGGQATVWEYRNPMISMPGGGVLFSSSDAPNTFKLWKNEQESVLGVLSGLTNGNTLGWVSGIDAARYVYVMCGAPLRQFCKSDRAL